MEIATLTLAAIGAYYLWRKFTVIQYKRKTNILPVYLDDDKAKGLADLVEEDCGSGGVPNAATTNSMNLMRPAVNLMQRAMNGDVTAAAQFNRQYDGETLFYSRRV